MEGETTGLESGTGIALGLSQLPINVDSLREGPPLRLEANGLRRVKSGSKACHVMQHEDNLSKA